MTDADIQTLKDNVNREVEIVTVDGERLVAKVLFVTHCAEYDEHDLLYEVIASNRLEEYQHRDTVGAYSIDFEQIVSLKAHVQRPR